MEDEDYEERIKILKEIEKFKRGEQEAKDDLTFKVNLKEGDFSKIFNRIDSIFEGNYLQFIKKIKNPYIKEIYVLLRKYQFYFTKMQLNGTCLFDFSKDGEIALDKFEVLLAKTNTMNFDIKLLPKFKKDEIDFDVPGDLFDCHFEIVFDFIEGEINFLDYHKASTQFRNLKLDSPMYAMLTDCVSNSLKSFILSYHKNIFQGVNKFFTYFENYFPEIYEEAKHIQKSKRDIWTQEEQNKFEEGYVKFKDIKSSKEKFIKITEYIGTKSLAECIKRYKKLREISIKDLVENDKSKGNNNKIQDDKNKSQKVKNEMAKGNKLEKKKQESSSAYVVEQLPENTVDLVDEILNQFNSLYTDVKFEPAPQKEIYTLLDHPQYDSEDFQDEDEEQEEEGYDIEEDRKEEDQYQEQYVEEEEKEESSDNRQKIKAEAKKANNKISNNKIESEVIAKEPILNNKAKDVNPVNDNMIRNIIRNGKKQSIKLTDIKLDNISLALISHFVFFIKCQTCRQVGFESKFIQIDTKLHVYYCGTKCSKCTSDIYLVFKADFIHINNTTAGSLFSVNAEVVDLLDSTYDASCSNCSGSMFKVKRVGKNGECPTCRKTNLFSYSAKDIVDTYSSTKFLDDMVIQYFQKYTIEQEALEDNLKYIKNYDKIGLVGNPLPDRGTCKHYKESYRWFRFSCCLRRFACPTCHDEVSDHASQQAQLVICGFCSFEQSSINSLCSKCGKSFNKELTGNGFWEGGKGCRDKHLMNNKDQHKFVGVGKTVSRKAANKKN
jgi:uncharacterized CHY-type Zn-finger protein